MALGEDWKEFLELLNSRGVEYVIIGAQSLAFHARPRHTGDLDILVRPTGQCTGTSRAAESIWVRAVQFQGNGFSSRAGSGAGGKQPRRLELHESRDDHS